MLQLCLQLVFGKPRPGRLHGAHVGSRRDVRGVADQGQLGVALDQASLVEQRGDIGEGLGRASPAAHAGRQATAQLVGQGEGLGVGQRQVERTAAIEQRLETRVAHGILEGLVDPMLADGPLGAETDAGPGLLGRVAVLAEQHARAFLTARQQDQQGIGLGKAGQVVKVAVLAEGEFAVARPADQGRAGQQHGAVGRQRLHPAARYSSWPIGAGRGRISGSIAAPRWW